MNSDATSDARTRTPQEEFWSGDFGDEYSGRNVGGRLLAAKTAIFARILSRAVGVGSIRELGANIGLNMRALKTLVPSAELSAVEINEVAFETLRSITGIDARCGSLLDSYDWQPVDLAFTSGVLIHLNPEMLPVAYDRLYEAGRKYVLVIEYYNPTPVEIGYRGHTGKLFKRDFAGELMDRHPDLALIDYGFVYQRDPTFPMDDLTWFLMAKTGNPGKESRLAG